MRGFLALVAGLVMCGSFGCAGYKLGPSNGQRAGAQSIQVRPFVNQTIEPRLTAAVTASIRKRLQQDGTYRLDTSEQADIVVSGTIIEFERSQISLDPNDVITPRDYRLTMKAHVRAVDRGTGRVLLNSDVLGRTHVRVGADLNSAERQAIPLMADDLARRTTSLLVDGAW